MFELVKIIWDVFVIRDATRRGQMNWRIWAVAIGFVLFLYGTGLPAVMLYQKNPQYKPVFIAAMVADGLAFVAFLIWGWRRYARQSSAGKRS